jgi:hypothetical protein
MQKCNDMSCLTSYILRLSTSSFLFFFFAFLFVFCRLLAKELSDVFEESTQRDRHYVCFSGTLSVLLATTRHQNTEEQFRDKYVT